MFPPLSSLRPTRYLTAYTDTADYKIAQKNQVNGLKFINELKRHNAIEILMIFLLFYIFYQPNY